MQFITTILALIVTLGILVTVHEFGHFWVARRLGVKVLRFSVGFGKPLAMWRDRQGTEYAIAAIPLGGYVKMLDEREQDVSEAEAAQSYNRQSPPRRIAIASAGPLANFIFAIAAYWVLSVVGFVTIAPLVGEVTEETPAAAMELQSGMEIIAIDGRDTPTWRHVGMALLQRAGEQGEITMTLSQDGQQVTRNAPLNGFLAGARDPNPVLEFGIQPWRPPVPAVLGEVMDDSPAAAAGLRPGDRIVAVDGEPVDDWFALVRLIQAAPGQSLDLTLEREGGRQQAAVTPGSRQTDDGREVGHVGAGVSAIEWPDHVLRDTRFGPVAAVPEAFSQFWGDTRVTLVAVQKMVTGLLSVQNLSGPITIARVAESSVSSGFEDFIRFLAYLSISLGILNLLPIPILDGGHIVFYVIEWVRGKPLSDWAQGLWLRVGLGLILTLMILALYNDLLRL
ncbi:MAG: RIP metalloprotease RseP [Halomonadaceae bacterium]|nr:MAG: RIP metalloprotease RseP [Halomonadaceae bacterium]